MVLPDEPTMVERAKRNFPGWDGTALTVWQVGFTDEPIVRVSWNGRQFVGTCYSWRFRLAGPPKTKEELVCVKIDKLWKRSQYYKEHTHEV